MKCPTCGNPVTRNAAYCSSCGSKLEWPEPPVPAKKKRNWWLIGCLSLPLLAILSLCPIAAISSLVSPNTRATGAFPPVPSAVPATRVVLPTVRPTELAAFWNYPRIDVRELTKNPDRFKGEHFQIWGEVFRIEEHDGRTGLQMWVQVSGGDTFDREAVAVRIDTPLDGVYEKTFVYVYGVGGGELSGTNAMGGTITQPLIQAQAVQTVPAVSP